MNMPRPPIKDPVTGLTVPQEQDPNQMMMLMALMGENPGALSGMPGMGGMGGMPGLGMGKK